MINKYFADTLPDDFGNAVINAWLAREDLLVAAKLISNFTKEAKAIIEQTLDVVSQWEKYAQMAEVPAGFVHEIKQHLRLNL